MLIVAPLNAQVAFACSMMDSTFHHECCCEVHDACSGPDSREALEKERDPCCERSVEIGVAHDAQDVLKPIPLSATL